MSRFAKYAWGVLACNLAVVLWGAYVRASGSGAGCGNHWPLCQGEVIPRDAATGTLIELAHRVSSGTVLLLVIGLFFWSRGVAPRESAVRLAAALSLVFMFGEALLGAGLVLFELVAHNDSLTRAFSLGAHLLNTFLLLWVITLAGSVDIGLGDGSTTTFYPGDVFLAEDISGQGHTATPHDWVRAYVDLEPAKARSQ